MSEQYNCRDGLLQMVILVCSHSLLQGLVEMVSEQTLIAWLKK
jgi:hypothetical protein